MLIGGAKSGGKPAFPTPRLSILHDIRTFDQLSRQFSNSKRDQLRVRKAGLPPQTRSELLMISLRIVRADTACIVAYLLYEEDLALDLAGHWTKPAILDGAFALA